MAEWVGARSSCTSCAVFGRASHFKYIQLDMALHTLGRMQMSHCYADRELQSPDSRLRYVQLQLTISHFPFWIWLFFLCAVLHARQSENDFCRKLACPGQFTLLLHGKQEVESIYKQELQTNWH